MKPRALVAALAFAGSALPSAVLAAESCGELFIYTVTPFCRLLGNGLSLCQPVGVVGPAPACKLPGTPPYVSVPLAPPVLRPTAAAAYPFPVFPFVPAPPPPGAGGAQPDAGGTLKPMAWPPQYQPVLQGGQPAPLGRVEGTATRPLPPMVMTFPAWPWPLPFPPPQATSPSATAGEVPAQGLGALPGSVTTAPEAPRASVAEPALAAAQAVAAAAPAAAPTLSAAAAVAPSAAPDLARVVASAVPPHATPAVAPPTPEPAATLAAGSAPPAVDRSAAMQEAAASPASVEVEAAMAYFPFDSDVLTQAGRTALDAWLRQAPAGVKVHITGHADRLGPAPYNLSLSLRRAAAAKRYLAQQGIPEQAMHIAAMGESAPMVRCKGGLSAATIKCLAPNRRVGIDVE